MPSLNSPRRPSAALLILLFVFTCVWFGGLDYRKLVKPDEGRYAEIPREMVATGDWLTPRLNGLKYFEKPALQYWATASAYSAFGQHEWSARLWPALTGFLGVLLAWFTGRRLFGADSGELAAMVLGSSVLYAAIGHINTLDMGLSFFMQLALSGFLLANQAGASPSQSRRWMLVTWAALALAVLSKGIVAPVLAGGTLVFYSLVNRDLSPWRRLHLLPGLALFFAITAPWFIAVCQANPEFFHFFFIHEHFERFLTKGHNRVQPWWFFLPILALGLLPWISLLPQSLLAAWRQRTDGFDARRFLLVWSVLIFAFFSVSGSKLPSYILPIFPALALLIAEQLRSTSRRALFWHVLPLPILAGAALVASPLVVTLQNAQQPAEMMAGYGRWLSAASAVWFLGSALALWLIRAKRQTDSQWPLLILGFASFLAGQGVLLGHENLNKSNSAAWLASQLPPVPAEVPFYSVLTYEQTLPFYIKRTVTLVEYGDELTFGEEQEPHKYIKTVAEFEARWRAGGEAYALVDDKGYARLVQDGLPMEIVAQDLRRIVIKKPR